MFAVLTKDVSLQILQVRLWDVLQAIFESFQLEHVTHFSEKSLEISQKLFFDEYPRTSLAKLN